MDPKVKKDLETRARVAELEVRAEDGAADAAKPRIIGYAAVFNSLSEDLGGFRETIQPGAFTRSLRDGADVRALIDHEAGKILGRRSAGTLELKANQKGLYVSIDPPATQYARDLMESMGRGDIREMSFAFRTRTDEWRMQEGEVIRELLDVDLLDVSVVTFPAYPATDVAVRSLEVFRSKVAETTEQAGVTAGGLVRMRMRLRLEEIG